MTTDESDEVATHRRHVMKVEITTCDGCGVEAPRDYSPLWLRGGWFHLAGKYPLERDVCSLDCLAKVVLALGAPMASPVDELEAMLALPAAPPKAPPKPRRPRSGA